MNDQLKNLQARIELKSVKALRLNSEIKKGVKALAF